MLDELQRGADAVGERDPVRCRGAEDVKDELAHRVRRQVAVGEQLVERGVRLGQLVAAVRLDQPQEGLARKIAGTHRHGEPLQQRMLRLTVEDALEILLELSEKREPVARHLVADLIDEAGEPVHGGQVLPRRSSEDERCDAEVLARGQRQDRGLVR